MNRVTFYELDAQAAATADALQQGCFKLIFNLYKSRKWVSVICANQVEAEKFDDLLWQSPTDRFIPHNLSGEGPAQGTPVEITWQGKPLNSRHTVINMTQQMLDTALNVQQVIDFVPSQDDDKQAARERYKQYKQAGCQMQFVKLTALDENS